MSEEKVKKIKAKVRSYSTPTKEDVEAFLNGSYTQNISHILGDNGLPQFVCQITEREINAPHE